MRFVSMATTDSSGRFAFEDLEPKRYRVTFQKPAYQVETRELTAAEESDLRVELKRGRGHRDRGPDGIFATPLRGLFVRVVDGSGHGRLHGQRLARQRRARRGAVAQARDVYEVRAESSGLRADQPARCRRALAHAQPRCSPPAARSRSRSGPRRSPCRRPPRGLLGADGRVYMWSAFTPDGKIRLERPGAPARERRPGPLHPRGRGRDPAGGGGPRGDAEHGLAALTPAPAGSALP